jgi:hypothetical protein
VASSNKSVARKRETCSQPPCFGLREAGGPLSVESADGNRACDAHFGRADRGDATPPERTCSCLRKTRLRCRSPPAKATAIASSSRTYLGSSSRLEHHSSGTDAISLIGICAQPVSEPPQLGCCNATPLVPHSVQRPCRRNMSCQPSGPRRMMNGAIATAHVRAPPALHPAPVDVQFLRRAQPLRRLVAPVADADVVVSGHRQ